MNEAPAKIIVNYEPHPKLTNEMIMGLMRLSEHLKPQEFATQIASNIAAIAFALHGSNDHDTVIDIFGYLLDQAGKQFEARKKQMVTENKPVFKL